MLDSLQRLALTAQLQERFALEIEQMLLAHCRLIRQRSASEHAGQRPADNYIVLTDSAGSMGEVNPQFKGGPYRVSANPHGVRRGGGW